MSDKGFEGFDKMSVAVVEQTKFMADFIVAKSHRGPGDTVEAAMHRAERSYGTPYHWLHRMRYRHRDLNDIPASIFLAFVSGYQSACQAAEKLYEEERAQHESNSALVGLADLVAGKKTGPCRDE